MRTKQIVIIWLLALAMFCFAANNTPWDGTEWDKDSPDIDQPLGNAYKEIYSLRRGFELRMEYEHSALTVDGAAAGGGVHLQGTAVAYHQDAIPTVDGDGEHFTTAASAGHLHIDTNHAFADKMFFLNTANGSGSNVWTGTYIAIEAELVADTHQWADVQTFDVAAIFTTGLTSNDDINLGAGDDLVGTATSNILMNTDKFTVAGATGNTVIKGTLTLASGASVNEFSIDDALAGDSDSAVPTEKSVKAYVDAVDSADDFTPTSYGGEQSVTFPNGAILKMGSESVAGNTTDEVTYGVAFPSQADWVMVSYAGKSTSLTDAANAQPKSGSEDTILEVSNPQSTTQTINWWVMGR